MDATVHRHAAQIVLRSRLRRMDIGMCSLARIKPIQGFYVYTYIYICIYTSIYTYKDDQGEIWMYAEGLGYIGSVRIHMNLKES